jgi:hypothetical protein
MSATLFLFRMTARPRVASPSILNSASEFKSLINYEQRARLFHNNNVDYACVAQARLMVNEEKTSPKERTTEEFKCVRVHAALRKSRLKVHALQDDRVGGW